MSLRIDKFLWCIRVYKTRSQATIACRGGKIKVNGEGVKPSYEVKQGDRLQVRFFSIYKVFTVIGFPSSRVPAKIVADYVEDITPAEDLEKLKTTRMSQGIFRDKGSGRPTKKDRRDIEKFGG